MLGPRKQVTKQQGVLYDTKTRLELALIQFGATKDFRGKTEGFIKDYMMKGLSTLDIYL